jgi:adenosylmethionine-8-amino-7-oxononanoate aminotransferase
MGSLSASGLTWPRKIPFAPFLSGFVQIPGPNCYHPPYGLDPNTYAQVCGKILEHTIMHEGPETVSAFIVEPVSNTGGLVVPPPDYLRSVRDTCTKHNVLLIFDEIITGMGRTGEWFASQTFDVVPDIMCCGKGLASGYAPLSAMIVLDDLYMDGFWNDESVNPGFSSGHTFGGNPISTAAGMAVIDVIQRDQLMEQGSAVGQHIRNLLASEVAAIGVLGEVRGVGALSCVEFVQDMRLMKPFPKERKFGKCVERRLREAGLLLRCDPDWIAFAPPFIMTIDQADEMLEIFFRCVRDELRAGA